MGNTTRHVRIAVLVNTRRKVQRDFLTGLKHFSEHGPRWQFNLIHDVRQPQNSSLPFAAADGIITYGETVRRLCDDSAPRVPIVTVGSIDDHLPLPNINVDHQRAAQLAAEHLIDRGYRTLVYYAALDRQERSAHVRGMHDALRFHDASGHEFGGGTRLAARGKWVLEDALNDLAELIASLDGPVGIIGTDDTHAERALQACARIERRVPDEAAAIGIGNDDLFCQFASPPLSSIALNGYQWGWETGEAMQGLLAGQDVPSRQLIQPEGVVLRRSSDNYCVDDSVVASALRFIRNRSDASINLKEIIEHLGISRSSLQRRFRKSIGRSPTQLIRHVRMEAVKEHLLHTAMPVIDIAARCGFKQLSQLSRDFKRSTGLTPTEYRERYAVHWQTDLHQPSADGAEPASDELDERYSSTSKPSRSNGASSSMK